MSQLDSSTARQCTEDTVRPSHKALVGPHEAAIGTHTTNAGGAALQCHNALVPRCTGAPVRGCSDLQSRQGTAVEFCCYSNTPAQEPAGCPKQCLLCVTGPQSAGGTVCLLDNTFKARCAGGPIAQRSKVPCKKSLLS